MHPISQAVRLWFLIGCDLNLKRCDQQIENTQFIPLQARPHRPKWRTHGESSKRRPIEEGIRVTSDSLSVSPLQSHHSRTLTLKEAQKKLKMTKILKLIKKTETKTKKLILQEEFPISILRETQGQRIQEWRQKVKTENSFRLINTSNII